MKKLTALLLALIFACSATVGCKQDAPQGGAKENETTQQIDGGKETQQQNPTKDVTEPVETFPPTEDFIKDYDQDHSQQGFSIKGKGYYYKGNDLMKEAERIPLGSDFGVYSAGEVLLLNVTNETDTNYTATLTVTYFNDNGKKLKTEKQTFEQFIAGYQRYFLFRPQNSYASYTCELSLTEYTGEINIDKFHIELGEIREARNDINGKNVRSIEAHFEVTEQPHSGYMDISRIVIVFDNTGDIYHIQKIGDKSYEATTKQKITYFDTSLYYTPDKKLVWPEELKGDLEAIVIFDILE